MSSAPRDNGVSRSVGRFASLTGLSVGALSGCVYWLAVQLWPSSVALMLSILAGTLLSNEMRQAASANRMEMLGQVFYVLIKYNVLMALSAANLPFAAPPNTPLCLIMICGYGASRSLSVWMSSRSAPPAAPAQAAPMQAAPLSHLELALTLLLGFAPAMLLGLPGLVGLAAAVLSVIAVMRARAGAPLATWITELTFYLGAQASWSYA